MQALRHEIKREGAKLQMLKIELGVWRGRLTKNFSAVETTAWLIGGFLFLFYSNVMGKKLRGKNVGGGL